MEALERLEASLGSGTLAPLYLITGEAGFLKSDAIAAVERAALAGGPRSFNHDRFDGPGCDIGRLVSAANTLPMMAPRRLVTLSDAHKLDDAAKAGLRAYAAAPSPTTVLLATTEPAPGGRPAWMKAFDAGGVVVTLRGLYESEMPGFIGVEARRLGKRPTPDAVRYLKEMVGTNLSEVRAQLTKAALFVGERPTLEVADLEAVVSDVNLDTVFAFTDAVGLRNTGDALLALDRLLTAEPYPARVLGMLHRHFRLLLTGRELMDETDASPEDIAARLGVTGGRVRVWERTFLPQLERWRLADLRAALGLLQATHRGLRSAVPPELEMERTVLTLCAQGAGPRR